MIDVARSVHSYSDYQSFSFDKDGGITNVGERMLKKLEAIEPILPNNADGMKVLDIGCDFGFWSFMLSQMGAEVTGLDRGRLVRDVGYVDVAQHNRSCASRYPMHRNCVFYKENVGEQWREHGKFDLIFLMSLYHHIYNNCGEHEPIWFWLRNQIADDGYIIWENPLTSIDNVVQMNVDKVLHERYTEDIILASASKHFHSRYIGPAEHSPTRSVYVFRPKNRTPVLYRAKTLTGAGGASPAFTHNNNERIVRIEHILGFEPYPGSLNLRLTAWAVGVKTPNNFDWNGGYYRAQVKDVIKRGTGLDAPWYDRWARFYPVRMNDADVFAFKFEGDVYPYDFVELISDRRLRTVLGIEKGRESEMFFSTL